MKTTNSSLRKKNQVTFIRIRNKEGVDYPSISLPAHNFSAEMFEFELIFYEASIKNKYYTNNFS